MTSPLDLHLDSCRECEKAMADPDKHDLCGVGQSLLLTALEESWRA